MTQRIEPNPTRRHPGFSLMELMVVIAIMAVLMGLVLAGVSLLQTGAQESHARTLLAGLSGMAGQMETQLADNGLMQKTSTDRTYDWTSPKTYNVEGFTGTDSLDDGTGDDPAGDDNGDYTYSNGVTNDDYMKTANLYIERFLWAANQLPVIREKLPTLGSSFGDADGDGFLDIVDPWGNPVAYANNVKHPTPNTLTSTNYDPEDDFLPAHAGSFFASAGPDQRWGLPRVRGEFQSDAAWKAYTETNEYKYSLDNIYSFDIDGSTARRGS